MSIWEIANPQLKDLKAYEPGKPIEDVARELGLDPNNIIKLASNENPLGPSPLAIEAIKKATEHSEIYPDGGGWKLKNAIADKFDLELDNIVLGNGSNEIIELIGHAFLKQDDEIIVSNHAFVVYKLMAKVFGANAVEIPDPNFQHDLISMAKACTDKTKEIFVTNPNNPTGTLASQEEIDEFMELVPEHVIVCFDEAYYEFLDTPPDTVKYIREGRNVVVLRTFSKIQGLAALRVGYGITTPEIAEVLNRTRQPFNVNALAQAGALAGLEDTAHQEKTKKITDEGRELLQSTFQELGIEYVPSYANFVMLKVGDADRVFVEMQKKGVIIRSMTSYNLPEWIRVTIGTEEQNQRFIQVLNEVL